MNAPTLLVGLGGTGSDIVQKVFERATPRQRENIGFVIFDTDVNELRVIEEKTPQIRTVQTSTRLTVGEYLDVDSLLCLKPCPNPKSINSGYKTC